MGRCSAVIKSSQGCVGACGRLPRPWFSGCERESVFSLYVCSMYGNQILLQTKSGLKPGHPCISATLQWLSVFLKLRLDVHVYMFVSYRLFPQCVLPLQKLAQHLKAVSHNRLIGNGQKWEICARSDVSSSKQTFWPCECHSQHVPVVMLMSQPLQMNTSLQRQCV